MKRIISLMVAVMLLFASLPMTLFASAEGTGEKSLVLPAGLVGIGEQAFSGNAALRKVVIPETVRTIGPLAFENCTGLTEVIVNSRDISIAEDAFKGCGRNLVFYTYSDSDARLWAESHGFACELLISDEEYLDRFLALVAHSGFNSSLLQSGLYASKCLIVRTKDGVSSLPDISAYHPIDTLKGESNLYYIQFSTEEDTENCLQMLGESEGVLSVEPDRVGESDSVSAQGVTIAEYWGTNDTMGFDVYAPFVADRTNGSVTVAVVDSGVTKSAWAGSFSSKSVSFVDSSAYTDSARHGSKVASIVSDCLGDAVGHAELLAVKVVNSSSMYRTSVIIEGIRHAINSGADVINLSLGWDASEGVSPEIAYQIKRANSMGIHVVVAAGNGSGSVMFPANCSGALAVSALTYSKKTGYSVSSRTGKEIAYTAPGLYLSTASYPNIDMAGDVIGAASTSFAAPQISAALALIELDPTKSGSAVDTLNSCCLDLGEEGLASSAYGHGMPQLNKLAVIDTEDIVLKNMDGEAIPARLWLGEAGNNFLLSWEILPDNASNKTVTVKTNNASVASVQQFGNTHALVSAKGVGEAVITVACGGVSRQFSIVVEKPVTEILITGSDGRMIVGKQTQLTAAVLPESAANRSVAWRSSNTDIAEVNEKGLVTPKRAGKVTITCEAQDGYGTAAKLDVTVVEVPDAESVVLTAVEKEIVNSMVTLEVGEILTLEAQVLPEDALQEVQYRVLQQGIVSITENGVISAVAPGWATIMVTAATGQNVYAGLNVNVIIPVRSVSVSADKTTLDVGDTTEATAVVLPENATDRKITWTSRNPSVATVGSTTGLVRAVGPGTAEITATAANGKQDSVTITVRQPITLTFDPNGGECSVKTLPAYSGYEVGALPEATREYWQFAGWYTAVSGGTKATEKSAFPENTTLYAQWTGMPYTVTFHANGGTCDVAEMTGRVGSKLGTLPTAVRSHYTFLGWYTAAEAGGTKITADYTQSATGDFDVYARWQKNPYTLTFNPNGGECSVKTMAGEVDTPIGKLPVPTRAYYVFDGWYTAKTGGTKIEDGYVNPTANNVTVYAHWTPMGYVMTFDANGGTCSVSKKDCLVDTDVGSLPTPTRDYYDFGGWYAGDSVHVTSSYRQTTNENVTVSARWTAHPYTITFDANGGECSVKEMTAYVDRAVGELPAATRGSYYVFEGWYTAKTGGKKVDAAYAQATDADVRLYARWSPKPYTVTFAYNDGTGKTEARTGKVDTAIGELPVLKRDYYTFDGWFTAPAGGTQITAAYVQATDQSVTFYAHWTPGRYDITFDANGGNCPVLSRTGTVGAELGYLPTPTREYYTFDAWYTAKTGGVKAGETYVQHTDEDITLYARWIPMEYPLFFNANGDGATVPVSAKKYKVDTAVGELPQPTLDYYTFDGWYTAADGGTEITADWSNPTTATVTAYAHWTENPFSDWVPAADVPSNARVRETKWKYTETVTSTETSKDGWTQVGSEWRQTGIGSFEHSTFQPGFDTGNSLYAAYNRLPYSPYENETAKRTVTNTVSRYVYWHWMYDNGGPYNTGGNYAIYYYSGYPPYEMTNNSFNYKYFEAFVSTENYTYTADQAAGGNGNWAQSDALYSWHYCQQRSRSYWWYQTPVYLCSYTDYTKYFTYSRTAEAASRPTASDTISDIQEWVRYQVR